MKKPIKTPGIDKAGIGKRFKIFIEIAQNPSGITMTELTKVFFDGHKSKEPEKFRNSKVGVWYHIDNLRNSAFITTVYENVDGNVALVCRATPDGVDVVGKEMCRLCKILKETTDNMIKKSD